ncbi:MAG TPA: hypothetical protein PLN26_05830 [Acidobacteriota bacterium]|nr:hypothetical protein [Acidobacteriota bacterium]HQF86734.1 hypothetical protein [Acidobacteriota bacterium]HQG91468.1 hypothetical protein [Acidobacteriota bacterium]
MEYPVIDDELARRLERTEGTASARFVEARARLRAAAAQGCAIAMMGAAPGGASQRNAGCHGFRVAYTRSKWRLD